MKAGLHGGDARTKSDGDLGMTTAFLHQGEQGAVLGPKLIEGMAKRIMLLGVHGSGGFGDVFMLGCKGRENSAKFLTPKVIDTSVACQTEKPRFKLRRSLETVDGADHFNENKLGDVLDRVAPTDNRVNKTRHSMLVSNDKLP
jgi:hypothetical protein